ncbi:NAD(P)-binding protein [Coccomyxa subellipsoidea C-169]|uniref:NAD(P)-binding protein n=1 Tax=Coccomyxa subellipsoidea (strain C-169) TaxID=574566 RepID=I0YW61_COCSC|nr:NAD(P)-binding protein [Coccomyxa subellipsoidea C-169]EIE22630.1 NAD(P)-binding protein [Coccomyxa subellipsoidea C-169]|eukprot:XP_005647174.1 NAD(P)-binding protein [Coccomyxa subellipsoidea C-169]
MLLEKAILWGANTGIGFETANSLASQGYATVLACRDINKGRAARDKIKAGLPGAKVEAVSLDLADLSTIRSFATKALDGGRPLDVLVNNAGMLLVPCVMATPELRTKDGFELQLGTNHLGHFLLTTMLLPLLTDPSRPSRIVNVSSSAHMFGRINFEDLQSRQKYQPWVAYGQSKLANVLFTYELARRLPLDANVTVNALHPGVVQTELQRYLVPDPVPWWQVPLLKAASVFLKTPVQGAATSIYLASSPEVEGVSSKYWVDCQPKASSKASYDTDVARKLWEVSQELTAAADNGEVLAVPAARQA